MVESREMKNRVMVARPKKVSVWAKAAGQLGAIGCRRKLFLARGGGGRSYNDDGEVRPRGQGRKE